MGSTKSESHFLETALDGKKCTLVSDHPHILESMHELTIPYKEQAHYYEAEKLLIQGV